MRRLLPDPVGEVDPVQAYADQPADWLRANMVISLDGSVTNEQGVSGDLGGEADQRVFQILRALCDGILVGAATARAERFGPYRPSAKLRDQRLASGKAPRAPIVVVSRSLDLHPRLLSGGPAATLVVTTAAAAARAPGDLRPHLLIAGDTEVDLSLAVRLLGQEYGLRQLLCEGGPHLLGQLVAKSLVDEVCLTLAPTLIGAQHRLGLVRDLPHRDELTLAALYEEDGVLFTRYRPARRDSTGTSSH